MEKRSIVSPIPGVFYRKPSPDKAVFVEEGQNVKAGEIIACVEVMKNYFELLAESDGIIEKFTVQDDEIVEAGQEIAVLKFE